MKAKNLAGLMLVLAFGCGPRVNPFVDELAGRPPTSTPSVQGVLAADVTPSRIVPQGEPKTFCPRNGSVTHGPLYFEDPYEENGSEDGQFAWTGEDYLWMVYWRARFMANLIAFPVSAVVTPPWELMVSDGYLSRQVLGGDHDAERLRCETR